MKVTGKTARHKFLKVVNKHNDTWRTTMTDGR